MECRPEVPVPPDVHRLSGGPVPNYLEHTHFETVDAHPKTEGKVSGYLPSCWDTRAKNDTETWKSFRPSTTMGVNTVGKSIHSCITGANHSSGRTGVLARVVLSIPHLVWTAISSCILDLSVSNELHPPVESKWSKTTTDCP